MNKIIYVILLMVAAVITSCEKDEEKIALTSSLNGEWEVMAYIDNTPIHGIFPLLISSDFPSKTDSVTINDTSKYFWNFQVKVSANHENGTFETQKSICEHCSYRIGVKVFNGKIINSDSIYLEIQFEDDETPYGNTYQLKGHRVK
ncbi:MAG TPA: hypothetical protein GXX42_15245 [Petrimonas sp.]|uniref:lipid-binding protein n=1 Tax=Petrimonas sp. TaxID=2023866 RepID=UPI00175B16B4|nr:lipid-binding protein [Petrimonas sp.]MEA4979433.1 lipid-binding protein [Petrimonas sp.]MEA5046288.1 lipid-binding protein [Petrimonas sp.]MEA5063435.1 lipid-binding protein [Petrimonas sp.]HHV87139.1 hypothetical protein [Petrimonas sp.]